MERHWVGETLGWRDIGLERHWVGETLSWRDIGLERHRVGETLSEYNYLREIVNDPAKFLSELSHHEKI